MYRIKDWDKHFENGESRKYKFARWLPVPNKHDGKGFRRMAKHPRKVEIFCAWNLILQVASKAPVRGDLADENGPLTAEDLADMTDFPEEIFTLAFEVLSGEKIGWIEDIREMPGDAGKPMEAPGNLPEPVGVLQDENNKQEKKEIPPPPTSTPVSAYSPEVTEVLKAFPKKRERVGGGLEDVHVGEGDRTKIADFINACPDYPILDAVKQYAKGTKRPKNLREWLLNPTAREIVLKAMAAEKSRDSPKPAAEPSGPPMTEEQARAFHEDVQAKLNGGRRPEGQRRMENVKA